MSPTDDQGTPSAPARALPVLLVVALTVTAVVVSVETGRKVPAGDAAVADRAEAQERPVPNDAVPAGARHEDVAAGFALDIPEGWFRRDDPRVDAYGPSAGDVSFSEAVPRRFIMVIETDEARSLGDIQDEWKREAASLSEFDVAIEEQRTEVGGRDAYVVRLSFPNRAPEPHPDDLDWCDGCVRMRVVVDWSPFPSIIAHAEGSDPEIFDQNHVQVRSALDSLSEIPLHERVGGLRRFLASRVRGAGAEEFLSAAAAATYEQIGLYEFSGYRMTSYLIRPFVLDADHQDASYFDVLARGVMDGGSGGGQWERIAVGPGVNQQGEARALVVLSVRQMQGADTS